jgi:hypothetical protein
VAGCSGCVCHGLATGTLSAGAGGRFVERELCVEQCALRGDEGVVMRHERLELGDQALDADLLRLEVRQRDLDLLRALFELREERLGHPVSLSPELLRLNHVITMPSAWPWLKAECSGPIDDGRIVRSC